MGVSYAPCPIPGSDAPPQAAIRKQKSEVSKKPAAKRMKAGPSRAMPSTMTPPPSKPGPTKKISIIKIARSKAKPGPQGTLEIELALTKPIRVCKKFCILDVAGLMWGVLP
jgi:hypothetical protein